MIAGHTLTEWISFHCVIFFLLALDLGVFNRKNHIVRFKEAISWTLFWMFLASLFGFYVYSEFGSQKSFEYFSGYIVELSLSLDNLFVFAIIFQALQIDRKYQHRLLFWGILGAIVFRATMIASGSFLLSRFEWLIYVFGAFLIYTGIKISRDSEDSLDPTKKPFFKWLQKKLPLDMSEDHHGKFFKKKNGRTLATTMFLGLIMVEASDIVFAVDSIPAVFGVTKDPFVVYTSNIFAILGLRSMFFALEELIERFHLLKMGLAIVLVYVGFKMIFSWAYHVPPVINLLIIFSLIGGACILSLFIKAKRKHS